MSLPIDSVWSLYLATRLHYLHSYDAVKYKGKLKTQHQNIKRPDKVLTRGVLTELANKREVIEFCVANFLNENDNFIYENQDDAMTFYTRWKSYWGSSDYAISRDVSMIETRMMMHGLFYEEYLQQHALKDLYANSITRESLCVLEHAMPQSMVYLKGFGSEKVAERVKKTIPFIKNRLDDLAFDASVLERMQSTDTI